MKKCKYLFLFIISLFIIIPKNVNAETMQYNFCFGDKGAYSVSYDSNIATEVTKEKIDYEAVKNGHVAYPNNATTIADSEKTKYAINVAYISSICYQEGETIKYCPTNSDFDFSNVINYYINDGKINSEHVVMELDEANDKIRIKLLKYVDNSSKKTYEFNFRYISDSSQYNKNNNSASAYEGTFLRSEGNYYILDGVNFGTKVVFEVYEKDSSKCNGTYLGDIGFITSYAADYEIDNPAPATALCSEIRNYYPDNMMGEDENLTTDRDFLDKNIKSVYISECYLDKVPKIKYSEKATLENNIRTKFEKLKDMFVDYGKQTGNTGTSTCENKLTLNKGLTYSYTGTYWQILCSESYTAQGDTAKLVRAGEGFEYVSEFQISRTCKIKQIKKPSPLPNCTYSISNVCTWNTKSGTGEGVDAGPSEYFDSCIKSCDGGKYTQNCINSCYKASYTNNRNWSFIEKISGALNDDSSSVFVKKQYGSSSTYTGPNTRVSCITDHGRNGFYVCHKGAHNNEKCACFSTWCGNNGGQCTFTEYQDQDNCSDNPKKGYQDQINESIKEYDTLKLKLSDDLKNGTYTIEITDSFLTSDKQKYVFTVSSDKDPNVSVTNTGQKNYINRTDENISIGTTNMEGINNTLTYTSSSTSTKNITVKLPLSYVNKITGGAVYKSDETTKNNAYEIFQNENGTRKLRKVQQEGTSPTSDSNPISNNGFVASRYYHQDDERKYYTSIWSQNTNVLISENRVKLLSYDMAKEVGDINIKVISSEVGDGGFKSNILCYYGVYNSYYCDNKDDCPPPPECKENCPDPTGIQYIYRVIDLTDVFPNDRNPRWNWTSSAARKASETRIGYDIDPIAKTKDIESKGESIYTDQNETDYEFYLTKENIRNIRDYNKHVKDYNNDGSNNYLDYNMSCYIDTKGRQICTSKFLDNKNGNSGSEESSNYITYGSQFTRDMRVEIAKCNDATGGGSRCVN